MVGVGLVFSSRHKKIQWKAGPVKQQFRYDSECQELNILNRREMSDGRNDRFLHKQMEKRVLYLLCRKDP